MAGTSVLLLSLRFLTDPLRGSCESLDEMSQQAMISAIVERTFPLHSDEVHWSSIPFRNYAKIVISGPQRSGTTFFAAALAKYLGYEHWDETRKKNVSTTTGAKLTLDGNTPIAQILAVPRRMVLQRPMMSSMIHKFPASPELFVGFLARNCLDVFRSQNRILNKNDNGDGGWTCRYGRTFEWKLYHRDPELRKHIDNEHDMICTIKQQVYQRYQRREMDRRGIATLPIAYSSFHNLPDFANSSQRTNFSAKHIGNVRRKRKQTR